MVSATRGRAPVFLDPNCASVVVEAVQFARRERAYVLAYVVMPEHFHALLVPRDGTSVSQVMQSIKGYTARLVNKSMDRRGPLWQRSCYDRMIRDDRQLLEAVNYVHANPVVAGLVENPEAYLYSSAGRSDLTDLGAFL
ncbi:MAG: transposase [Chloroflexi bacterium]|nr:transposase [Chloroflexota bacterium]